MTDKKYKVAFHGAYGFAMSHEMVNAVKSTPSLTGYINPNSVHPCTKVPRHHPDFVKIVEALPNTDWEIELLDSPMYIITEYDGKEMVVSLTDLTINAAEFDKGA